MPAFSLNLLFHKERLADYVMDTLGEFLKQVRKWISWMYFETFGK